VGFAIGFDRVVMALENQGFEFSPIALDIYIIPISERAKTIGFQIANKLRDNNIAVDIDLVRRNISKGLKYANAINSKYTIIIGDDELVQDSLMVRNMMTGDQQLVKVNKIVEFFK
jgi:histidyl-tRNA synthetase